MSTTTRKEGDMPKTVMIDGIEYVEKTAQPTGTRTIVVLDRGFIFVGDLVDEGDTLRIANAQNVRRWSSGGFGGMCRAPKHSKVECDPCADVICAKDAPLFTVPVPDDWNA